MISLISLTIVEESQVEAVNILIVAFQELFKVRLWKSHCPSDVSIITWLLSSFKRIVVSHDVKLGFGLKYIFNISLLFSC